MRVPARIVTLIYRSHAVRPLHAQDMQALLLAAQSRNLAEGVTGLILYQDEQFYQWLEGPAESVDRIMRAISKDPRHTDVEVLDRHAGPRRVFGGSTMRLAAPDCAPTMADILDGLRHHPEDAAALLAQLADLAPASATRRAHNGPPVPQDALRAVVEADVLPALVRAYRDQPQLRQHFRVNPRALELAHLLVATNQDAAVRLIELLNSQASDAQPLSATVLEPAARFLGELWSEDLCSEIDVTIGLAQMQSTARRLCWAALPLPLLTPTPAVLIAPEPGELHGLGASLDSTALWQAGWTPTCEFPQSDHALSDLLAKSWFDVLDLSLSAAFRREHWLARTAKTIASARGASLNPGIVVVVGGRVFTESDGAGAEVGADIASRSSVNVDQLILRQLRRRGPAPQR
jgi:hypothetical protein